MGAVRTFVGSWSDRWRLAWQDTGRRRARSHGGEDEPTFVLLHGLAGSTASWDEVRCQPWLLRGSPGSLVSRGGVPAIAIGGGAMACLGRWEACFPRHPKAVAIGDIIRSVEVVWETARDIVVV